VVPKEAVVVTTSNKDIFVVTQFCATFLDVSLKGSTLGWIPVLGDGCTTFSPGIALPPGEELVCTIEGGFSKLCMVNGVWVKK
jgi:hypothetical protein